MAPVEDPQDGTETPAASPDTGELLDVYLLDIGAGGPALVTALALIMGVGQEDARAAVRQVPTRILAGAERRSVNEAAAVLDPLGVRLRIQAAGRVFVAPSTPATGAAARRSTRRQVPSLQTATVIKLVVAGIVLIPVAGWARGCAEVYSSVNEGSREFEEQRAQEEAAEQDEEERRAAEEARTPPEPSGPPTGAELELVLAGLAAASAELADFGIAYGETGYSSATAEACAVLERQYPSFNALPGLDGSLTFSMDFAKSLYYNAQQDCKEAFEEQRLDLLADAAASADEGFVEILGLYSRLSQP